MIQRLLLLCLFGLTAEADAHDFWLQPQQWETAPGEEVGMMFQVGHGADRQQSTITAHRVLRFQAISPEGKRIDLRQRLSIGERTNDATIAFDTAGGWLVVLETDNSARSHLPAARFNDYLEDEGLTEALTERARTGRSAADGAERYSRHAKAIVQVGALNDQTHTRVSRLVGLALEIVPEINPLTAVSGDPLPIRVYYRGKPLPGALVKLNDLASDAKPIDTRRCDADGRAIFTMPGKGSWQFNVVWIRPAARDSLVDFDTNFSSLTFGTIR